MQEIDEGLPDSVIEFLASQNADVNHGDLYGLTPLHYASFRGNVKATQQLLKCPGIDIECQDEQNLTPLHLACTYGQVANTKVLLNAGADIKSLGEKGQTSLHKAAAIGNTELVILITDATRKSHGYHGLKEVKYYLKLDLLHNISFSAD